MNLTLLQSLKSSVNIQVVPRYILHFVDIILLLVQSNVEVTLLGISEVSSFVDSLWFEDNKTHGGNLTLSLEYSRNYLYSSID